MLITFANSLDPDQAQQIVKLFAILREFLKKVNFEKKADDKHLERFATMQRVNCSFAIFSGCIKLSSRKVKPINLSSMCRFLELKN